MATGDCKKLYRHALNYLAATIFKINRPVLALVLVLVIFVLSIRPAGATSASISVSRDDWRANITVSGSFTAYENCNQADPPVCTTNDSGSFYVYHTPPGGTEAEIGRGNGNGSFQWSGYKDAGILAQGSHQFRVHALDSKSTTGSGADMFEVDNTPVVNINPIEEPEGWFYVTGTIDFKRNGSGTGFGRYSVTVDGIDIVSSRGGIDFVSVTETPYQFSHRTDSINWTQGEHAIRVEAIAANGVSIVTTGSFSIDNTPTVHIDPPGTIRGYFNAEGTIDFKAIGDDNYYNEGYYSVVVDGNLDVLSPWGGIDSQTVDETHHEFSHRVNFAGGLISGEHTLTVNAATPNGASKSETKTFTANNNPIIEIYDPGQPTGPFYIRGHINFAAGDANDYGRYALLFDGQDMISPWGGVDYRSVGRQTDYYFEHRVNYTPSSGDHTIHVYAYGLNGERVGKAITFNSNTELIAPKNLGECGGNCETRPSIGNNDTKLAQTNDIYPSTLFPINFATGNKYKSQVDFQLSGPGLPFGFTRYYNSQSEANIGCNPPEPYGGDWAMTVTQEPSITSGEAWYEANNPNCPDPGYRGTGTDSTNGYMYWYNYDKCAGGGAPYISMFHYYCLNSDHWDYGYGWTVSYSEKIAISDGTIILREADGAQIHFRDNGQGTFVSEADHVRKIVAAAEGHTLTEPDGRTLSFNASGHLIQIADRNGNTQTITHVDGRPYSVEDNFGRRIEFHYSAQGQLDTLVTPVGNFTYQHDANNNLYRVNNPEGTFRTYIYDDANDIHNLTGITNEKNVRTLTAVYDANDRAIASERANGADRVEVTYDSNLYRHVTDSLGNTTTFKLHVNNGIGRVKSSSGAGCGSCLASIGESYLLNNRLQMSQETDGEGAVTSYTYDDRGNVLTKTEAVGTADERTTIYTYHPDYALVATITRQSVANSGSTTVTTFSYDANANRVGVTVTGYTNGTQTSITTTLDYNSYGQLTYLDGPKTTVADIVRYEYYPNDPAQGLNRGQLEKIIDPLNRETVFAGYNGYGKPQSATDINNVVTILDYDTAGRMTHSTRNSLTTVYGYDEIGQLETLDLPNGQQIVYRYDDSGNNTRITDKLGNYIVYGYNSEGKRNREEIHDTTGELKKYTDFEYDPVNRLWKTVYPDGTYAELLYDNNNNIDLLTDANGKVTDHDYDDLNRLEYVTQPGNTLTTYGYDTHDNLTSVKDAENLTTTYQYDDFGRVETEISPDTGTTAYLYDLAGNLESKTDANNTVTTYVYDILNRLTDVIFSDTSQNIAYSYDEGPDGLGRLTGMTDPSGAYVYGYDVDGNLDSEQKTVDGITYTTGYDYDAAGLLTDITYPDGRLVTYARDAAGNVTGVTTTKDGTTSVVAENIAYLPFGPLTDMTMGSGTAVSRQFNERYLLENLSAGSLMDYTYDFDNVGNITDITDGLDAARSQSFGYDDLYRLNSATGIYGSIGYTYDKVGNRQTRTLDGQTDAYTYEPGTHKLTGITGPNAQIFGYDAAGNTTSKGQQTLAYNLNNRLIRITDQGTTVGEYVYNGKGQRIKKTTGGDTTIYHYDLAGNLIGESDTAGVFAAQFIYLGVERLAAVAPTRISEITVQVATDAGRNLPGIRVYAFTDGGAYTGKYATTGDDGVAAFGLDDFADGSYKFRADYLGDQFWTPVIAVPGLIATAVPIPEDAVTVQVTQGCLGKAGVRVYLFNEAGSYLGQYQTTDANGEVTFVLPEGQGYKFRADVTGGQFYSETVTIVDGANSFTLDTGGGILTLTLSKGQDLPMAGIRTYLFTASGSYLGQSGTTDALGKAGFAVPSGSYKIRADYLGYQFWTNVTGVTTDAGIDLEILHQDVVITVAGQDDADVQPREGVKAYLFTPSGSYLRINATSDDQGRVTFNLPSKEYKVRVDYMSQQFWSGVFVQQDTAVTIPECRVQIFTTRLGNPLADVDTFVFGSTGSYLYLNGTTDAQGNIVYRLPAGTYNFRGDYLGSQYFSGNTLLVADQSNPVEISTGGGNFTLTVEKEPGLAMAGVKNYLFTDAGSYLGHTTATNAQGESVYELADGSYNIRSDYMGYQFWTPVFTVPDSGAHTQTIAHSDVTITVDKQNGAVNEAIENIKVYLFTASGSYQGLNSTTDIAGQVTFNLPAVDYKVRADYLSGQYWSEVFNQANQTITVSEGTADITVSSGVAALDNVRVYVFTASGSYLGLNGATDPSGLVEFVLPVGDYKFRADYQGSQYWVTETIEADQVNAIDLNTGGGDFVLTVQKAAGVPMVDVPVYAFSPAGGYLGINARTDSSGQVNFSLSEGSYMFRADYLGYQFWSNVCSIPGLLSDALTIAHTDVSISINQVYGVESNPLENIPVYLFTDSGSYRGINARTDVVGQVVFSLPDKAYKVRADYLGGQHWSDAFTSQDTAVDIEHGYANIHVTDFGLDVDDSPVYLFTQAGSYLGRMQQTDSEGNTTFLMPAGAYKFRVDHSGTQYWSDVVNILAGDETAVDLALDLLALDDTRNPHPKRFDGVPPELDPIMLASLMDITGILNQSVVAATGPDALHWYVNDHLGTPEKVVDANQAVVWEGSQEPFGKAAVMVNTLGNNFRFPGQYFDTESGLHYNYYRYFDPNIGRYLKTDPVGLNGGINLFSYVHENPITAIDPWGLQSAVGHLDWFSRSLSYNGGPPPDVKLPNTIPWGEYLNTVKQYALSVFDGSQMAGGVGVSAKINLFGLTKIDASYHDIAGRQICDKKLKPFSEEKALITVESFGIHIGPVYKNGDLSWTSFIQQKNAKILNNFKPKIEFGGTVPYTSAGNAVNIEIHMNLLAIMGK